MYNKMAIGSRLPLRRGLSEPEAALYVGLGSSKFRELVDAGVMPRPHLIGRRRIWDIDDLDAAFKALPVEGGETCEVDTWADMA
jgi:predicted DNA-binding transcriptional regulator AlpA